MSNLKNSRTSKSLSITYILLYFPYLTETFIADEIREVQNQGCDVQIISLLKPKNTLIQPLSKTLLKHTSYAPGLLNFRVWKAQFHFLRRSRRLYFRLLSSLLNSPIKNKTSVLISTTKRLVIFFKSVFIAYTLKDCDISLFHSHFAWLSGVSAWICSRLLKKPFTITIHAFDIYAKSDLLKLVLGQAAHIISISKYNRDYICRIGICPPDSVTVVHCGLNLSEINYESIEKFSYQPNTPIKILSVGSLTAKKGHKDLIEACYLLKKIGFKHTCTIIGSGKDESKLRNLILSYGLQKHVFLIGSRTRPEIIEECTKHNLFVLASIRAPNGDMDGIPVVMMEAAAMGLPLISTQVSGIPELIQHYKTGLLVPPSEPKSLADAIVTLSTNPKLQYQLSRNARKLIEKEFSQEDNTKLLIKLFHSVSQRGLESTHYH